ncbi:MAG: class I SAM-dependent methyltransferase [Nitrospina sp.]|nr:class I SAM-dependent methyltransferase [Nitrospina sp.]MBT6718366.1 class I SAM-dependent methyltransferase [Nitrospina sp.]
MSGWYQDNYWKTGFKSSLYDMLTPESYLESMRQTVKLIPDKAGLKIWDAGCGSGLLLVFLKDVFKRGINYYGSDLLSAGLMRVQMRAKELMISEQVVCFKNDLAAPPFKENSLDIVVAHFSIYTIREKDKREQALKNMWHVLRPGGILLISNPSKNYNSSQIIEESLKLTLEKKGFWQAMIKRILFYPFTKFLGLNFIQKQLKSGLWIDYTIEGLAEELQQAGFKTGTSVTVYAGSAYLMCGHKMV